MPFKKLLNGVIFVIEVGIHLLIVDSTIHIPHCRKLVEGLPSLYIGKKENRIYCEDEKCGDAITCPVLNINLYHQSFAFYTRFIDKFSTLTSVSPVNITLQYLHPLP